jgi:hypothetical protein
MLGRADRPSPFHLQGCYVATRISPKLERITYGRFTQGNKSDYDVAKAYRPIRLLNTLGKGFDTLISRYISYLCEKHNLLPPSQFGGRRVVIPPT